MCFWKEKPKTVDGILEVCNNDYNKVCTWIRRHIWYVSDKDNHNTKEYWQTPQETLTGIYRDGKTGKPYSGDCEDFVILAQACFTKLNIDSYILGVHTPTAYAGHIPIKYKGHAILAFTIDNKWYHFSNWGKKLCRGASRLEDVAKFVYKKGYWQECWYKNGVLNKGKITLY